MLRKSKAKAEEKEENSPPIVPFMAKNRLSSKPTPEEINKVFTKLLAELDYHGPKLAAFDGWTTDRKKSFIMQQEEYEQRVPSPDYIIDQLQKGNDISKIISTINISIRTARLSWIDQFCTSGGHVLLLRELARLTAFSQCFHHSFPYKNTDQVNEVIKALKSIVDCRNGSQHMLYFVPGIEIITSAVNRYDFSQFETLLYLLVPYIFMDSGPKLLLNSLRHLAELNQQKHVFRIFTDLIENNQEEASKSNVFIAFLNGLYTTLSDDFADKLDIIFYYLNSDLINMFNRLKPSIQLQFGPILPAFLFCINSDLKELKQLFNAEPFKCAKLDDLVNQFNKKSIGSIIMNLVSIQKNQPELIEKVLAVLYHFLLYIRKKSSDRSLDFNEIAFQALDYSLPQTTIQAPPLPPESSINSNSCYEYLHKEYEYIADNDFTLFCKSWKGGELVKQVLDLNDQIEDMERQMRQHQEEAQNAKLELEAVKKQLAAKEAIPEEAYSKDELTRTQIELEDERNSEIAKLRAELESVKADNDRLRASQQIIMDLASYVPADLQQIKLKPLTTKSIIPPNRVDIQAMLDELNRLRQLALKLSQNGTMDPTLEQTIKNLEQQILLLQTERSTIDTNTTTALQDVKEDRMALTAEFNQVKEIQHKIIYGLKQGTLFDDMNYGADDYYSTRRIHLDIQEGTETSSTTTNTNGCDSPGRINLKAANQSGSINVSSRGFLLDEFDENEQELLDQEAERSAESEIAGTAPSQNVYLFPLEKLPADHCNSSQQWKDVQQVTSQTTNLLDETEVFKYFAVGEIPADRLLSEHTSRKIDHILTATKLSPESITREIRAQSFKLDEKILNRLLHLPMSTVEIEKITSFNGDVKTLPNAERFAVLLYQIPDWRGKVALSIELHQFDHDYTILMQNLDKILAAIKQITDSKKLPILISSILTIANFLNGGTRFGAAQGFSLQNLKDLKQTKSTVKGVSLLNYIAKRLVDTQQFDITELQAELDKLQPATRFNLIDINEKLKNAQMLLANRRRTPFVRACSRRIFDAMKKVATVQKSYNELEKVYGIREDLLRPGTLIPTITDFAADFSRALKENRTNQLGGKVQQHKQVEKVEVQPAQPADENQRGYLDVMVDVLSKAVRQEGQNSQTSGPSDFERAFAKVRKSVT